MFRSYFFFCCKQVKQGAPVQYAPWQPRLCTRSFSVPLSLFLDSTCSQIMSKQPQPPTTQKSANLRRGPWAYPGLFILWRFPFNLFTNFINSSGYMDRVTCSFSSHTLSLPLSNTYTHRHPTNCTLHTHRNGCSKGFKASGLNGCRLR